MKKVRDLMDTTFATVKPETPIIDAIDTLMDEHLMGILVVDDDFNLLGILSEKDCLKVLIHDAYFNMPSGKVKDFYHKVDHVISSNDDIVKAAEIFLANSFRRMPVIDDGKLVGQITRRDILKGFRKYNVPEN